MFKSCFDSFFIKYTKKYIINMYILSITMLRYLNIDRNIKLKNKDFLLFELYNETLFCYIEFIKYKNRTQCLSELSKSVLSLKIQSSSQQKNNLDEDTSASPFVLSSYSNHLLDRFTITN